MTSKPPNPNSVQTVLLLNDSLWDGQAPVCLCRLTHTMGGTMALVTITITTTAPTATPGAIVAW
jgi:hypothetical protein